MAGEQNSVWALMKFSSDSVAAAQLLHMQRTMLVSDRQRACSRSTLSSSPLASSMSLASVLAHCSAAGQPCGSPKPGMPGYCPYGGGYCPYCGGYWGGYCGGYAAGGGGACGGGASGSGSAGASAGGSSAGGSSAGASSSSSRRDPVYNTVSGKVRHRRERKEPGTYGQL